VRPEGKRRDKQYETIYRNAASQRSSCLGGVVSREQQKDRTPSDRIQTDTNVQLRTRVERCILVLMECCQESTAMNNELSRVVNVVATASLIENWINV